MSDGQCLNMETIAALRSYQEDGQPDFLTELIDAYLDDSPQRLSNLHRAIENKDAEQAARVAHALKGSSGNLGAERLAGWMLKAEMAGKNGEVQKLQELLPSIQSEFDAVSLQLRALRIN